MSIIIGDFLEIEWVILGAKGAKFQPLRVFDRFTRESLAIETRPRLRGEHVVVTLDRMALQHRKPNYLHMDNGSEFSGRLLDLWAYHQKGLARLQKRVNLVVRRGSGRRDH